MNTLYFLQQYQNQGATVGTAFPRDLETYMGMIGDKKIYFNMRGNQKYYKKIKTKTQLHLI